MTDNRIASSRSSDVWLTPPALLAALGEFDLDPASPIGRPWDTARHHYTILDDGLRLPWFGRVWLNPPYGRVIGRWLARLAQHGHGTALIFARTDTDVFFRHVWEIASGLLFIRGRVHFMDSSGSVVRNAKTGKVQDGGAPSVLCAYGMADLERLASSGIEGQLIPLRLPRAIVVEALPVTWSTWLLERLGDRRGPIALADLYRLLADDPRTRARRHWRDKVRQVLQEGPFRRVGRGLWEVAA